MADLEITAAAIGWDDEVREAMKNRHLLPGADLLMAVEFYETEVRAGRINLIRYSDQDGRAIAHVGWYIDVNASAPDGGDEFVIAGAVSALPKLDMVGALLPGLENMAREHGCASIRFGTVREALANKVQAMGWERSEVVMRRVLT